MGDSAVSEKLTVLVTGFGPFATHTTNSSWVSVQEMARTGGLGNDVNLIIEEIPVEYDTVSQGVPRLWTQHQPQLVVHVGVSGIAKELTLEQQAHNDGYDKLDVKNTAPVLRCCVAGGVACLVSDIDMKKVSDTVNASKCGVDAVVSHDPGRYLCDFIYYTSLNQSQRKTAFIHVPPLDRPYTAQQLAIALRIAITAMLDQLY